MSDEHMDELIRQCANYTPAGRLSTVELRVVFDWLIDGGHMIRTGKSLDRPRSAPRVEARTTEGAPIYGAGADFSSHDTVTMDRGQA